MGLLIGFTTILVVIAVGSALAHTGVLDDRSQRTLGEIAFFVATPALMLVTISRVEVSGAAANLAASAGSLAFCFGGVRPDRPAPLEGRHGVAGHRLAVRVVRQRRQPRPGDRGVRRRRHHRRGADAAGADAVRAAGVPDRARPGHRGGTGVLAALRRLTTNPLTAAALLGVVLAVTGWSLPEVVWSPIELLASAAIPLMLLSYGAALRLSPRIGRAGTNREVLTVAVLKLAVMPVVAWLLGVAPGPRTRRCCSAWSSPAALPTAQNIFLHATRYRTGEDVARESILVTTLCSLPIALRDRAAARLKGASVTLLDDLRSLLGPAGVLTPAPTGGVLRRLAGAHRGSAAAVLRPASTAEVAAAVAALPRGRRRDRAAGRQHRPVRRRGARTPSGDAGRALAARGCDRVRAVDAADRHDDGRGRLRAADAAGRGRRGAGRLFPLSLGAEGSCTIGGNLATNAGGTAVLRYGNDARARASASRWCCPTGASGTGCAALRKDNTGYDLQAAVHRRRGHARRHHRGVLKLFPRPARRATAWVALADARRPRSRCCGCCASAAGERLTGFELMSAHRARAGARATCPARATRSPRRTPGTCWSSWRDADAAEASTRCSRRAARRGARARPRRRRRRSPAARRSARRCGRCARASPRRRAARAPSLKHDVTVPVAPHRRLRRRDRRARSRRVCPGVRLVDLRPRRRRQPALQPQQAGAACDRRRLPRARAASSPTAGLRRGRGRAAAASAPSTASGTLKRDAAGALQDAGRARADARRSSARSTRAG